MLILIAFATILSSLETPSCPVSKTLTSLPSTLSPRAVELFVIDITFCVCLILSFCSILVRTLVSDKEEKLYKSSFVIVADVVAADLL